jgi:hypothetical protein
MATSTTTTGISLIDVLTGVNLIFFIVEERGPREYIDVTRVRRHEDDINWPKPG